MSDVPRTVIEFQDVGTGDNPLCHRTREVLINGTPVLIQRDGIDIEHGGDQITVVTLRILPTEVHFNHKSIQEAHNGDSRKS